MHKSAWPAGATLALVLAGCAQNYQALDLPKVEGRFGPQASTAGVTQRINCELARLVSPQNGDVGRKFRDFVAAVQLSLDVTDDANLAPSFGYTWLPFSFAAGAKLDASRDSNFSADLYYDLKAIAEVTDYQRAHNLEHPGELPAGSRYSCDVVGPNALEGDLGLTTAALTGISTENENEKDAKGEFGGKITFNITKNLTGVGPTWTFTHYKGVGALAGVSENNLDSLAFGFARRQAADPTAGAKKTAAATSDAKARAINYINVTINGNQFNTTLTVLRDKLQ